MKKIVINLQEIYGESQSFIHQVRILSSFITSLLQSLSFAVAILYSSSQNSLKLYNLAPPKLVIRCRNPLFIKSEFSPQQTQRSPPHRQRCGRNPLFIKSEFSPEIPYLDFDISFRSQSFIHQVRILSSTISYAIDAYSAGSVAILYSSSQNSLLRWKRVTL